MSKIKIINRGKMTYVIYPEKVVVGLNMGQWVSYNPYENWNRQGISQYRQAILDSKEGEYDNPVDHLSLVYKCGIRGNGTSKPKEVE